MEFYFLNWVQLSDDFGKVFPVDTTQGYFHLGHEIFVYLFKYCGVIASIFVFM
jgi:hypothetical protein